MDIKQPNENDITFAKLIYITFQFLAKNILGLLAIMFGVVTKVYIIRKAKIRC